MTTSRRGKIARLPRTVRAELNQRLENGEPAKLLVAWLNGLPEVQALVAAEFGGKAIREQNLSEWRKGGYRDWLVQQEALELAGQLGEDAVELQAEGGPPLTDTLALWLAARYAVATRQVTQAEGAEGWRLLRELCADVVELRRGDHSAERLRLEHEQLAVTRQRTQRERVEEFWKWVSDPEVREQICRGFQTRAEMLELVGQHLFGDLWHSQCVAADRPNEPGGPEQAAAPVAPPATQCESSLIKAEDGE